MENPSLTLLPRKLPYLDASYICAARRGLATQGSMEAAMVDSVLPPKLEAYGNSGCWLSGCKLMRNVVSHDTKWVEIAKLDLTSAATSGAGSP